MPTFNIAAKTSLCIRLTALITLFWLQGCYPSANPGSLVVPYVLGNNKTCEVLGVHFVRAKLDDGKTQQVDCAQPYQIRFDLIEAGSYNILVEALDVNGTVIMDNKTPDDEATVEVIGDNTITTADPIFLTDSPARLKVRWRLGQDGFGTCQSLDIARFAIQAWDTNGTVRLHEYTLPCDLPQTDPEGYRDVPDPEQLVNGNLLREASIQALDENNSPIGGPVLFQFPDYPGPGQTVKLSIHCPTRDTCAPTP